MSPRLFSKFFLIYIGLSVILAGSAMAAKVVECISHNRDLRVQISLVEANDSAIDWNTMKVLVAPSNSGLMRAIPKEGSVINLMKHRNHPEARGILLYEGTIGSMLNQKTVRVQPIPTDNDPAPQGAPQSLNQVFPVGFTAAIITFKLNIAAGSTIPYMVKCYNL